MPTYNRTQKHKAQQKAWRENNPNKVNQLNTKARKVSREREPWLWMWRAAKERAKQRNLDFNITPEYLRSIWPDVCPILGIPLHTNKRMGKGAKNLFDSRSLDRIDSAKGYVVGNVAIISYKANVIKNNGTADEHRLIAEWMEKTSSCSTSPSQAISTLEDCAVSNDQP
jgi:hypothetical protein